MAATSAVALAAVLGGAFYPGPRIVIGVLMAVTLGFAAATARDRLRFEEWAFLAFIVWGSVAAVAAASTPLAARETVVVWLIAWGLWLWARRTGGRSAKLALIVLASAALILALGVIFEAVGAGRIRVGGLLENPNIAASLLVVVIPVLLVIDARPRWTLAAGGFVLLGLVVTGSRAGLLAVLVVGAMVLPRGWQRTVGLAAGALGVVGILAWRFINQPDILAWFRPAIWGAVIRIWGTRPLTGTGPGGLADAAGAERLLHADHVGRYQFLIAYSESTPLAVLVQTGLVGLIIVVGAGVLWWLDCGRRGALSRLMRGALAGMLVMGAFHDLLTVDIVLWWWALTIGLMEARYAPIVGEREDRCRGPSSRAVVGIVFALVVLWGVVQPAWARWLWRSEGPEATLVGRATRAELWYDTPLEWRARDLLRRTPWTWREAAEAIAISQEAVRVHPGAARLWTLMGIVHARVVTDFGPWPNSVQKAREGFARAVELEPHQPWARLEWARLERNLGHTERSVELVEHALEAEPHTVRARLFLARLRLDQGNRKAAREAFDTALETVRLRSRRGLNAYERELLRAPPWQFGELAGALQ
jgi:cytochrome c-type biogenesis protein CcmH/NrfG/O-antigen ligase